MCCFLLDTVREKYSYISHATLHFICMWPRTFSTISWWLGHIRNLLICRRIQQKIHETQRICSWLERIRSLHKEFASLLRIQQKIHETHKIWHPSEQNYLLFTSVKKGACENFENSGGEGGSILGADLGKSRGKGSHRESPFHGVVWIFSGTTHSLPWPN